MAGHEEGPVHTTLTSKGQVTLPKALRDRLNLAAGDRIAFIVEADDSVRLVVKPASIERLKGMLPRPRQPVPLEAMEQAIAEGARRS